MAISMIASCISKANGGKCIAQDAFSLSPYLFPGTQVSLSLSPTLSDNLKQATTASFHIPPN
jgi:hypothetical protein